MSHPHPELGLPPALADGAMRIVALYRGKGRIIFSQESVYSSVWRVLELQPNPNETGYP